MIRRLAVLALAGCCLALAGCVGSSKPPLTGPATLVPAGAPVYGEVLLKPRGETRQAVETLLSRLFGSRPQPKVERFLDQAIAEHTPGFTYTRDIKPWVGARLGFFASRFSGQGGGAGIVEVKSPTAALAAVDRGIEAEGLTFTERSYKGVRYKLDSDGDANGIVDRHLVSGTEDAFKAVVDAHRGSALAETERFAASVESLPDDRLTSVYLDPQSLFDYLVRDGMLTRLQVVAARRFLGDTAKHPVLWSQAVRSEALISDLSFVPPSPATRASLRGPALGELPAEAWLALGLRNVGDRLKRAIEQSDELGAQVAQLQRQAEARAPIDFNRDLLSWLGDARFFLEGTSKRALEMALVLGATDPEAAERAIGSVFGPITPKLTLPGGGTGLTIPAAPQLPGRPIHIAQREDKVVIAAGDDAGEEAFSTATKLADTEGFQQADVTLGNYSPIVYLAFRPALRFVEQFGRKDPQYGDYLKARPYLQKIGYAALGAHTVGERDVFRLAVGLSK